MNANVIIAVAAVAVTLFSVIFIVIESQHGYEAHYFGVATSQDGQHFNFAKGAAGNSLSATVADQADASDNGSVLIATIDGSTVKFLYDSAGTLTACDSAPTETGLDIASWSASSDISADGGSGNSFSFQGATYTYEVTEGDAPDGFIITTPTKEDCDAAGDSEANRDTTQIWEPRASDEGEEPEYMDAGGLDDADPGDGDIADEARRMMEEMIDTDSPKRSLGWWGGYMGRKAKEAYNGGTCVNNACVTISGCTFAFRGSDDLWDWVSNLGGAVFTSTIGGARVHGGFAYEYLQLYNNGKLNRARSCRQPHWVGHSLGGAMANVARQHWGKGTIWTWGAPATFNNNWNHRWQGMRYWHDGDPVPSSVAALGRHHAHGSMKFWDYCSSRHWWGWCTGYRTTASWSGYDSRSWIGGNFGKHNMDNYATNSARHGW